MSDVPVWAAASIGVGAALIGLVGRAGFEEVRDFRGARRVVVSELTANITALEQVKLEIGLGVKVPHAVSDDAYRAVQLVLARYLPDSLWKDLVSVYARFSAVKAKPAKAYESVSEGDNLVRDARRVSTTLSAYHFVRGLIGRGL